VKIESLDAVFYTAVFLLPGFFMRNIAASINPARKTSDGLAFLHCLMYSVINLAVWSWAYNLANGLRKAQALPDWVFWMILTAITLTGAVILSLAIGAITQRRFIVWLANKLRLNAIDPADTAWDWLFAKCRGFQLVVTLKDDTEFCGWYGPNSFTSSETGDRDIYIEYTYTKGPDGTYRHDPASKGVYIPKDSIKYIELKKERDEVNENE
jgi:hypothetical protein